MELIPLPELSQRIHSHLKFSKNWGGPESALTVAVVFFYTGLPKM